MIPVNELAVLAQLTYVAYNRGTEIVLELLQQGEPPFLRCYQKTYFLHANRLFQPDIQENCCGLIVEKDDDIIIAIRGTENLDDYFYDLFAIADLENDSIHMGFLAYVDSFFEQVTTYLSNSNHTNKNLYITGHSLGGAAGIVLLNQLQKSELLPSLNTPIQAYTFGAPPVSAAEITISDHIHHYRNEGDFIPHLPQLIGLVINQIPLLEQQINRVFPTLSSSLNRYSHNANEDLWMLGYDCSLLRDKASPDLKPLRQIARSLVLQNPLQSLNQIRKNNASRNLFRKIIHSILKKSVEEHRAKMYIQRLFNNKTPSWYITD